MSLKNLKIGYRLGFGFGILLLLGCILAYFSIQSLKRMEGDAGKLHQHPFTVTKAALRIDGNIVRMQLAMRDAMLAGNKNDIQAALDRISLYEKQVRDDFKIVEDRFLGEKATIESVRTLFDEWKPMRDEIISLVQAEKADEAARVAKAKQDHIKALSDAVANIIDFAEEKAKSFVENSGKSTRKTVYTMFGLSSLLAFLGILFAITITRSITRPLRKAVFVADSLAENDFTVHVDADRNDEVGQLLNSLEKVVENLSLTISANASASESLSQAASEQAASLEESSSSMEELDSMTKQNAHSAEQANEIVLKTHDDMKGAMDSLEKLTAAMNEISGVSKDTFKIIKAIDEIAFQTNLLSLNAAVEAARAGEAGAGFAVVAEEVRNLAMRAADAARETADLIEKTVAKIDEGSKLVSVTNDVFTTVGEGSEKIGDLVSEIAAASKEQASGFEQISRAIAEMDKVTQDNAATAEELASSMAMFKIRHKESDEKFEKDRSGAKKEQYTPASKSYYDWNRNDKTRKKELKALSKKEVKPEEIIPFDDDDFGDF